MKTYTARATRSGNWWAITVDGLKGAHSQARRLNQVEANAREVVALIEDIPDDSFDVEVEVNLDHEAQEILRALDDAKRRLNAAQEATAALSRSAVDHLVHEDGLTMRDAGKVMGVSYQRVAQLADSEAPASTAPAEAAH